MQIQAAVLRTVGLARPYTHSRPLTIEAVELSEPGPGEVLVQIAAAGVCHSDLSVVDGARPRPVPMVIGHEAAGIVRAVGPGVDTVAVGDHVVFALVASCGCCVPCQTGRPVLCEDGSRANAAGQLAGGVHRLHDRDGTPLHHHLGVSAFAEYVVVSGRSAVPIDRDLPLEQAALFGCGVLTGVGAVLNTARSEAGSAAVIFGLGGIGLSTVMGAALAGCHPIVAVDLLDEKLTLARDLGATHAVRADTDDALTQIRSITRGGGDYCFEAVGSAAVLAQAYAATRRGGTTVSIGLAHPAQQLQIQAVSLVAEERTIKGSFVGSAVPRRDIPRYIALFQAGKLPVDRLISGTLGLDDINQALEALAGGAPVRQLVRFSN